MESEETKVIISKIKAKLCDIHPPCPLKKGEFRELSHNCPLKNEEFRELSHNSPFLRGQGGCISQNNRLNARNLLAPFVNGVNQEQIKPCDLYRNACAKTKQSAVLLLLWERQEKLNVVFTLRSVNLLSHSGQISFPGGTADISTVTGEIETAEETALRETFEEIGISPHSIEVFGTVIAFICSSSG